MVDTTQLPIGDIWPGYRPRTAERYSRALDRLAAAVGAGDAAALLHQVEASGPAGALAVAGAWVESCAVARRSPSTLHFALAALRAALAGLRTAGRIAWAMPRLPQRLPRGRVRDVTGPPPAAFAALLERPTAEQARPSAARDLAALRLSWDLGLRRAELSGLDLADLEGARLRVRRKGGAVVWLTVPGPTVAALAGWLAVRGGAPGPLLAACSPGGAVAFPLRPLAGGQWWRRLRELGAAAGVPGSRPHALRHGSATALLLAGVPPAAVAGWLGHHGLATVQEYADRLSDQSGAVAAVAAALPSVSLPSAAPAPRPLLPPGPAR
jgi:integrase/recombinase XerC